jgi:hypothetical protein
VKHHGEQDQAERKDEDEGNGSGDCSPAKEVCRGAVVDLGGGRGTSSRRWLRSPEGSARQLKVEGKNSGRRAPATNDRIAGRTSAPESMNGDARRLGRRSVPAEERQQRRLCSPENGTMSEEMVAPACSGGGRAWPARSSIGRVVQNARRGGTLAAHSTEGKKIIRMTRRHVAVGTRVAEIRWPGGARGSVW